MSIFSQFSGITRVLKVTRGMILVALLACSAVGQYSETFHEPHRFLAAHGRRAWAGGYANGGWEVWTGSLQIADEVRPEFRRAGDTSTIPGAEIVSRVNAEPSDVSRTYTGPDFAVDEEVWVPLDARAVLIHYTVRSTSPVEVIVRFHPSLNLMWPAALGGQEIYWDRNRSGYVLGEPARQFAAVVLAPGASGHDEPLNNTRTNGQSDNLAVVLSSKSPEILFAQLDLKPGAELDAEIEGASRLLTSKDWQQEKAEHYRELANSELQIETPNGELNRALGWAEIALDQGWFCNEKLGCAFVAGYGPSRRGRRPQYAWYFAGDGMVDLHAALAASDLQHAREEIRFIAKYQDEKTGMVWHELSQSAPYLDWRGKYPYMFVHADLTYPYISTVADYVRASGDRAFLTEIWPSVQKAFEFGRSMIGGNGLPEVPEGKEGANEQTPLREELGLSASWVEACAKYAQMAKLVGDERAASESQSLAEKARANFGKRYWDSERDFAIQGFHRDGSPVRDRGLGALEAVSEGLLTEAQASKVLDEVATWKFQSDWGTRSVAIGEPGYDPTVYAHGSVWGISTANVAQAYWTEHRPDTAWQIWRTLIPWSTLDSPGHMHEVLAGDTFHPQFESVPEQAWSTAAFFSTAVHGLLGLDVNAETASVTFAPHMPGGWDKISVRNARLGNSSLTFELRRSSGSLTLHVVNSGEKVRLAFRPEIPMGARLIGASMGGRDLAVKTEAHSQDQHAAIEVVLPQGESDVAIRYQDGVELVMEPPHPSLGDTSKAMKLVSVKMSVLAMTADLDLIPAEQNALLIRTSRTIESVDGAKFERTGSDEYRLTVTAPNPGHEYERRHLAINFKK